MKLATVCPVWKETRYLPLVLEQMNLCPGPKLVVWQDEPLYWLGNGPSPSGWNSKVGEILAQFPDIEAMKIKQAAHGDETEVYGGFLQLATKAFEHLREKHGTETVFWTDSDWLFDLGELRSLYLRMSKSTETDKRWAVKARHYWRDFNRTMDTGDVTVGYSTNRMIGDLIEPDMIRDVTLYHAAYVWSDAEMYDKVHAWGHAPLFKERGFYEKEWVTGNDSIVSPKPADVSPPASVMQRLEHWKALL